MAGSLTLKWGTLKAWDFTDNDKAIELLEEYNKDGHAFGAMQQRDTESQKRIICGMIDAVDEPIFNDWSGEEMTRAEAKKYVMEYRQPPTPKG